MRTKPAVVLTFDLAAVSARLQSHSSGGGDGDGGRERQYGGAALGIARFRTKISPASSSEAEEELRKEIRSACGSVCVCVCVCVLVFQGPVYLGD